MASGRLTFQNWIVEIGYDPREKKLLCQSESPTVPNEKIIRMVRHALAKLYPKEREFIRRYYFLGESYQQIAETMGIRISRMDGINCRIRNKLKKLLASFVKNEFDLDVDTGPDCPICISPLKDEINRLLESKTAKETWRPVIQKLKEDYGIIIKTPQILIGHQKYHKQPNDGGFQDEKGESN